MARSVSRYRHRLIFRVLAARQGAKLDVYWLRGNHDYVVPAGPWEAGEFYVNPRLRVQVLAEHGDRWDKDQLAARAGDIKGLAAGHGRWAGRALRCGPAWHA